MDKRFHESTRGQIVALLRRGERTVEELAIALELTDNAVRNHLSVLERDRMIRQVGVRRGPGAGKPAALYALHPDAAPLLSRAYPPVLQALVEMLAEELSAEQTEQLLQAVGRRLARGAGGRAAGDLPARLAAAAGVLESMGADIDLLQDEDGHVIRGSGCPLSVVVTGHPAVCRVVETLIAEITGAPVRTCCTKGATPRCCFQIASAA